MFVRSDPHLTLYSIVFLEYLSSSMLLPVTPYYALGLGATTTQIALLGTSFALTQLLFGPYWGRLSDRIGRRRVLTLGLLGTWVGFVIFALAPSVAWLFVARIVSGTFCVTQAMVQASVTNTADRTRTMLAIGIASNLGEIVGPLSGGLLDHIGMALGLGHRLAIWCSATCIALNLLFTTTRFHRGATQRHLYASRDTPSRERSSTSIWVLFAAAFATAFAISGFEWTTPLLTVERLQWNERLGGVSKNAYVLGAFGVIRAGVQAWLRHHSTAWKDERSGLVFALIGLALGFVTLAGVTHVSFLVAATALIGGGAGLGVPLVASLISKATPTGRRGYAFGSLQSVSAIGYILGPACIGVGFQTIGSGWVFALSGLGLAIAALLPFAQLVRARNR